jgi:hypothetical protein
MPDDISELKLGMLFPATRGEMLKRRGFD